VHGERAGFLNEAWDAEFLELLETSPETLVNMRLADYAAKGGMEGAEVIMWLIMRGALSERVRLVHKQTYAPSVTNIATLVLEDLGEPASAGRLASLGLGEVAVLRRLRVAYFSTGDEILSLGQAPREGAVYDSNRYTVFGLLTRLGCEVIDLGVVRDEPALLEAAFTRAARAVSMPQRMRAGSAPTAKVMASDLADIGSPAPWPWPLAAGAATAAFGLATGAGSLSGGAGSEAAAAAASAFTAARPADGFCQ